MFEKLVAIEPVSLIPSAEQELHQNAEEVTLYRYIGTRPPATTRWCAASGTPTPGC